jgi:hypothetical protein
VPVEVTITMPLLSVNLLPRSTAPAPLSLSSPARLSFRTVTE